MKNLAKTISMMLAIAIMLLSFASCGGNNNNNTNNNQGDEKEENNEIIMMTKQDDREKELWIDTSTGKPTKLEIKWTNKNTNVYILYNEVNVNS